MNEYEIFRTGRWPGSGGATEITFTEADLDGIVSSFDALSLAGRIPLKVGHQGKDVRVDDTAPALGWVQALRREGSTLLADIKFTSQKLVEGIKTGAYKFVSAELLHNVKAHTRLIPWVLDAVALLGATAPAVGTLKDLQASMQSFTRRGGLRFSGTRLAFRREDANQPIGESNDMDEAAVQALVDKAVNKATADVTTKFTAQVDGLKTQLDTSKAETVKAKAEAHRTAILAPFDAAIHSGLINAAAKDAYVSQFNVSDDTAVVKLTVKQSNEHIDGVKDIPKFKGPGVRRAKVRQDDQNDFTGKTNAEVVTLLKDERIIKTGGKLNCFADQEAASQFVLRTNRELAKAYMNDMNGEYQPPAADKDAA